MELTRLYDEIKNPLDDEYVIKKIIEAYSSSEGQFYSSLIKTMPDENKGMYYIDDADKFYSKMFNEWKKNILSVTKSEFQELKRRGIYSDKFVLLRNFISRIKDISTKEELTAIKKEVYKDEALEEAFDEYYWESLGEYTGWVHVSSKYVNAKKTSSFPIEHRLYLNTSSTDTLKMTNLLVEKFKEHDIPYYFKFSPHGGRDDSIVIYTSTELLGKNIDILKEIKEENKELAARLKRPPILTGVIDGFIGYGSNHEKTNDGKKGSFSEVRAELIEEIIKNKEIEWISKSRYKKISLRNEIMPFDDYMARIATDNYIKMLERRLDDLNDYHFKEIFKIEKKEVESKEFRNSLYNFLYANMPDYLDAFCNRTKKDSLNKAFYYKGNKITYEFYNFSNFMNTFVGTLAQIKPNFINEIKEEIKENAPNLGINPNKFCFDIIQEERIRKFSGIQRPENRLEDILEEKLLINTTENVNYSQNVTSESIIGHINPTLLARNVKTPKGKLIPAKQYIQEYVFDKLPTDGLVLLSNNAAVPPIQFIEEQVLGECQDKYDGDIDRYMLEKTRKNNGSILLENNGEKHEFPVEMIMNTVDKELLKGNVSLPDGSTISVYDYVEKLYLPQVPYNGMVTISSSATIPVREYIEELLIPCVKNTKNNDIQTILTTTTKNNNGVISIDDKKIQELRNKLGNVPISSVGLNK